MAIFILRGKDGKPNRYFRSYTSWISTLGRHGDLWMDIGRVKAHWFYAGREFILHQLGKHDDFRVIDDKHPVHTHFVEVYEMHNFKPEEHGMENEGTPAT